MTVPCPYCSRQAKLVSGRVIYPHRPDLAEKRFWLCTPCDAYCGTHPDGRPLGRLANAALRKAKMAAHAAFDPLWHPFQAQQRAYPEARVPSARLRGIMRTRAYHWLAEQMGLALGDCHIGMFDEAQCRRVVEIMKAARIDARGVRVWVKERRATA